jgi:hypothetical protein
MKKQTTIWVMLMLMITGFSSVVSAQTNKKANEDTEAWRYELEVAGTGVQGTYLLKVWSYSKKPNVAIEQAKKNAVHGVSFLKALRATRAFWANLRWLPTLIYRAREGRVV